VKFVSLANLTRMGRLMRCSRAESVGAEVEATSCRMTSLPLNEETEGVGATQPLAVRPELHNLCQEISKTIH
jgi:hypothetical protein